MSTTVIKAGTPTRTLPPLRRFDLADHLAEARAIMHAAQREAEIILAKARAESDCAAFKAHEAGYETGFREGEAAGRRAGHEAAYREAQQRFHGEHDAVVSDFVRVIQELEERKQELMTATQGNLLDFAVLIAGKLTMAIADTDEQQMREIECGDAGKNDH